jgi:predicted nucleic acid binding AN1-type Zn finger protein
LLPASTEIDFNGVFTKAQLSMNSAFRGITIDLSFEYENAFDSIRFNDDGDSNEIDESDLQETKHDCPRISIKCGIIISVSISNP